jgi:hypothetical protein
MMRVSTAATRRTDPATLGEEEVGPNAALAPLHDYAFLQLLVNTTGAHFVFRGKGDYSPMHDLVSRVGHVPETGVVVTFVSLKTLL